MKKILVIIKREYLTRVRTRAFVLGTIGSPLLLIGIIVLPMFFVTRGGGDRHLIVLDQSGDPALFETFKQRLDRPTSEAQSPDEARMGTRTRFSLSQVVIPRDQNIDEVRRAYNSDIEKETNGAYIVLREGVLNGQEPEYFAKNVSDFAIRDIERSISAAISQRRLVREGFDPEKVRDYMRPVNLKTFKVRPEGESEESGSTTFQVGFAMLFFIYVTVLVYGITVMRGVIEEKQSRVVEILLSSVSPVQLMWGKLIGIGLVALTQYIIWVLSLILISLFGSVLLAQGGIELPKIPVSLLVYFVVYFILGYFLFGTLYLIVGAMVSSEEDAQQVQFPIMMLIILPMVLFGVIMNNPNGPAAVTLSLIPFFGPTLMMLRIAVATPPLWQILLSILLIIGAILLVVWLAAKIYRVGVLMYGKRPSMAELGRWLRYS
ncbi:MAG TPA: ABC transporter permease [Blastocatellia bacterium]|nr:ABC transporter permease [Blastocatellia bacterium]